MQDGPIRRSDLKNTPSGFRRMIHILAIYCRQLVVRHVMMAKD